MRFVTGILALSSVGALLWAETTSLQLETPSGWGMFGSNIQINDFSPFDRDEIRIVWTYDEEGWHHYPKGGDLSVINVGDGFWIYAEKSSTLMLQGESSSITSLELPKGFSLKALPDGQSRNIQKLFADGIMNIYFYENGTWNTFSAGNVNSSSFTVEPGMGFYIKTSQALTLSLDETEEEEPSSDDIPQIEDDDNADISDLLADMVAQTITDEDENGNLTITYLDEQENILSTATVHYDDQKRIILRKIETAQGYWQQEETTYQSSGAKTVNTTDSFGFSKTETLDSDDTLSSSRLETPYGFWEENTYSTGRSVTTQTQTDSDGDTRETTYDASGRISQTQHTTHDELNVKTNYSYYSNGSYTEEATILYSNELPFETYLGYQAGYTKEYDSEGRLKSATHRYNEGSSQTFVYSYQNDQSYTIQRTDVVQKSGQEVLDDQYSNYIINYF